MPLKIYRIKDGDEASRLGNAIIDDETVVKKNNNNNSFDSIRILNDGAILLTNAPFSFHPVNHANRQPTPRYL